MRTLLILLFSFGSWALPAQSLDVTYEPPQDLEAVLLDIIEPLDLAEVPSGYLYERGGEPPCVAPFGREIAALSSIGYRRSHRTAQPIGALYHTSPFTPLRCSHSSLTRKRYHALTIIPVSPEI